MRKRHMNLTSVKEDYEGKKKGFEVLGREEVELQCVLDTLERTLSELTARVGGSRKRIDSYLESIAGLEMELCSWKLLPS